MVLKVDRKIAKYSMDGMVHFFPLAIAVYLWGGWYYETDREVVVKDGVLVFKDDGKPVPKKEPCKT